MWNLILSIHKYSRDIKLFLKMLRYEKGIAISTHDIIFNRCFSVKSIENLKKKWHEYHRLRLIHVLYSLPFNTQHSIGFNRATDLNHAFYFQAFGGSKDLMRCCVVNLIKTVLSSTVFWCTIREPLRSETSHHGIPFFVQLD